MNDESRPDQDKGTWEIVYGSKPRLLRMKVPDGWLVTVAGGFSYPVTFYPDLEHKWTPRVKS